MALLNVDKLSVHFGDENAPFRAVDRISYSVKQGEVVGIVGESGSGKSVSSLAIMGLIDYPGRVMADKLEFNGRDLQRISEKERRQLVGAEVAMIFQDPMTSLNPCFTVGYQIMEAIKVHQGGNKQTRRQRAIDLLNLVGIPDPASRLDVYPHQLSGGMSQRVMIAMAIACRPKLLIADEPTTALDVTIQAQIIELLLDLQQQGEYGAGADHPRPGAGGGRPRIKLSLCTRVRWWRPVTRKISSARRAILIPRRCCARCRNSPRIKRVWPRCRAWCRGNMTVPTAACLIRAAPMPRINAVAKSRRSRI
ncbi:dipeptide transport ATP-binding protein DppD [Klebsiella pneumoniae subsp. rhinoscleromatis]|nr:dipeptide transport ATP-binding protein DppD [Klebsiella pneumoniae subsp. rhinoscleromatis]